MDQEENEMADIYVNRWLIPEWGKCLAVAFVYPNSMGENEKLLPLYDKLFELLDIDTKIVLLVRSREFETDFLINCRMKGINNHIEFIEFPELSEIWIRDFAPLIVHDTDVNVPWKLGFRNDTRNGYSESLNYHHKAGIELGEKMVGEGVSFNNIWLDPSCMTCNGRGLAIISNRVISRNETLSIDNLIKPFLLFSFGIEEPVFIPVEPGDETGHVNTMVRFISDKVLVVGQYAPYCKNHKFMEELASSLQEQLGEEYSIIRLLNLDLDDSLFDDGYRRHMDFIRINNRILFPYFNKTISEPVLQAFQQDIMNLELDIEVVPLISKDIDELVMLRSGLNCLAWPIFSEDQPRHTSNPLKF